MVTMLSTGLDGAAGLRAIADRTVFAAWQRQDSARAGASTEEALSIARSLGAEYAILGSAVQLGGELRLVAEVRRTGSGNRLGQVDVEGTPDSVTALANRLTRKSLGVLLNRSEEQIPSVNLQSITTSSLNALKAFLQGERHFRAGEYEPAIKDYEAATQNDSTFALAYARLAVSRGWRGGRGSADGALRRAYQLSERLSRREQRLIRARYLRKVKDRPSQAADNLRQLTEDYPEDPSVWYFLGEALYHGNLPDGLRQSEAAFQEAVRLDSGVAPYHHHLVELAFKVHHDSALAARRIEAHPDGARKRWYQTAWDLVFGSPERREDAWARVDTLAGGNLASLQNPLDWKLYGRALRILSKRETTGSQFQTSQATYELWGGRVDSALQHLPDQAWTNVRLALAQTLGYPIPDSLLQARLAPQGLGPDATPPELAATGLYLIEQGREKELGPILERLDSVATRDVKGYRAFRAGNLEEAAKHWEAVESRTPVSAIWRGDLYRKLGNLSTARDWYRAAWDLPVAHERLGQLYEDMDQPEKAQAAYQRLVAAWEGADPELQPRVETARERIGALTNKSAAE